MIRLLSILFLSIFCSTTVFSQDRILEKLMPDYMEALHDCSKVEEVYAKFQAVENPSANLIAFRAALEAIMTKTTWNLFKKISYLNDCEASFKQAIALEPNDIEVRFMRLSVEHEIPLYLGYSSHIEEDKKFVVAHIEQFDPITMDPSILKEILAFVKKSGHFNSEEILLFESLFASIN